MLLTLDDGKTIEVKDYEGDHESLLEHIARMRARGWDGNRLFCMPSKPDFPLCWDEYRWYLQASLRTARNDHDRQYCEEQIAIADEYWPT
jgi:hypothetical protein